MHIVTTSKENISDTKKDLVTFIFNDELEIKNFISKLSKIKIKKYGMIVLVLSPNGMEFSDTQKQLFGLFGGFDGVFGKDHDAIVNSKL